ncbi:glycoside hydrolase family 76 protein [Cohnella sp.]|uniref:glycoside hydrolase family 76 protein n=1 Tax=Cohnella sp. TaxID=1883426 RepID=UPI003569B353
MTNRIQAGTWKRRAEEAQRTLDEKFWNPSIDMYDIQTPCPDGSCNTIFHYWWMAHAVEALVDGLDRTGDSFYTARLRRIHQSLLARNGGVWPNNLYDDMEWMAIAWLRAYHVTGDEVYKKTVHVLWEDIKTGWNDHMGGGIAWQKTQLDYKNTPANAPAVILAVRLYTAFGNHEDLEWAKTIYDWQKRTLVDPLSGFVWDGVNRLQDGMIDKDWKYTYCQGVFIGAAIELHRVTEEQVYLADAERTWNAAVEELTESGKGLFPPEGTGDGGLFKGILARYAGMLARAIEDSGAIREVLFSNAKSLWETGRSEERALFGEAWNVPPNGQVELSTQLSGVILIEAAALLE